MANFKYTDLAFWKNREQQFINFQEQIDQQIGNFLTITKSPSIDIYKQIIETTVTGKSIFIICIYIFGYISGIYIINIYFSDHNNYFVFI